MNRSNFKLNDNNAVKKIRDIGYDGLCMNLICFNLWMDQLSGINFWTYIDLDIFLINLSFPDLPLKNLELTQGLVLFPLKSKM